MSANRKTFKNIVGDNIVEGNHDFDKLPDKSIKSYKSDKYGEYRQEIADALENEKYAKLTKPKYDENFNGAPGDRDIDGGRLDDVLLQQSLKQ